MAIIFTISVCTPMPRFTSKNDTNVKNQPKSKEEKYENVSEVLESVTGPASFYAEPFHGRLTANGEIFDKNEMTAAHTTYPFNTILRVTNLTNNKSVLVRINDRFPEHPTRIIDLSYGVAMELDMLNDGVAEVRLDVLEWGE